MLGDKYPDTPLSCGWDKHQLFQTLVCSNREEEEKNTSRILNFDKNIKKGKKVQNK